MSVVRLAVWIGAAALAGLMFGLRWRPQWPPAPAGIMPAPATCGIVAPCRRRSVPAPGSVLGGCLVGLDLQTCPQVQLVTLTYRGTVTFNSDMTYVANTFTEDRAEIDTEPISCWGNPNMTCAEEDEILKTQVNNNTSGELSYASCTGSTTTCTCTIAQTADLVIADSGTYSLEGTRINFTSALWDGFEGFSYCVQDNMFHLMPPGTSAVDGGAATTIDYNDIVAQKQ